METDYSAMGRDQLLTLVQEQVRTLKLWQETTRVALDEHEAMLRTLTAAQESGTEAQLGRQRARALLREVLASGVLDYAYNWLEERLSASEQEDLQCLAQFKRDIEKELAP